MKKQSTMFSMTSCALMAALMCVLCPISIPIGPVPISLLNFIVLLTVYLIGTRASVISFGVYLLLGAAGLPVFTNFQGGLAKMAGPTGGYLIGVLPMIFIAGILLQKSERNLWISLLGMILGIAVEYLFGTAWFLFQTGTTPHYALEMCVYPFIPFDLAKSAAAVFLGRAIRSSLQKAGVPLG